jgi:hypothetical protein
MKKKLILHIGMHKTGTSSIQQSLFGYNDGETTYLSDLGVNHSLPIFTIFSNNPQTHYIWKERNISIDEIGIKKDQFKKKLAKFVKKSNHKKVIISGEDIGFLKANEKNNLLNYFIDFGYEIKIVCLFRDPYSYAASDLQQKIKGGKKTLHMVHPFYLKRLNGFTLNSNNVSYVIDDFNNILKEFESPVQWFLNISSLKANKIIEVKANESLSDQAMKIVFLHNKYGSNSIENASMYRAKKEFISIIKDKYEFTKNQNKDKDFFINLLSKDARNEIKILNQEIAKVVNKKFDYKFQENQIKHSDILEYLEDRKTINKKPINELLNKYNINYENLNFIQKLDAIYLAILRKKKFLN